MLLFSFTFLYLISTFLTHSQRLGLSSEFDQSLAQILNRGKVYVTRINKLLYLSDSDPVINIGRRDKQIHGDDSGNKNNIDAEEALFNSIVCQPGRIYIYPCILCVCHPMGYFKVSDCIHVCHNISTAISHHAKCIAGTIFKVDCNLCYCPREGIIDKQYCSRKTCTSTFQFQTEIISKPVVKTLRNQEEKTSFRFLHFDKFKFLSEMKCSALTFTKPLCQYCICHKNGKINFDECIEIDCKIAYKGKPMFCDTNTFTSICQQCLCMRNGTVIDEYCHYLCNTKSKAFILKKLVSNINTEYFPPKRDLDDINTCQPGSLYKSAKQYCYCPSSGIFNKNYCLTLKEKGDTQQINIDGKNLMISKEIELGNSCVPGQYFKSAHKQCFCPINGQVDSKWCTDIDTSEEEQDEMNSTCIPGKIVNMECNLCICSIKGNVIYYDCTKNKCDGVVNEQLLDVTSCMSGIVFTFSCISCLCPSDGQINVNYCHQTKHCTVEYDDLDECRSGELYVRGCEICVCPRNGVKSDSVCYSGHCPPTLVARRDTFSFVNCNTLEIRKNLDFCEICLCGHCKIVECKSIYDCRSGAIFYLGPRICRCQAVDDRYVVIECGSKASRFPLIGRSSPYGYEKPSCFYNDEEIDEVLKKRDCTPGTMYYHGCQECICAQNRTLGDFCKESTRFCETPHPGGAYYILRAGISHEIVHQIKNEGTIDNCLEGFLYYDGQCEICPCINGLLDKMECYRKILCIATMEPPNNKEYFPTHVH